MEVIMETERLFLRKMNRDNFDALYQILADPDIMQHYPYTFDERRELEKAADMLFGQVNLYRIFR